MPEWLSIRACASLLPFTPALPARVYLFLNASFMTCTDSTFLSTSQRGRSTSSGACCWPRYARRSSRKASSGVLRYPSTRRYAENDGFAHLMMDLLTRSYNMPTWSFTRNREHKVHKGKCPLMLIIMSGDLTTCREFPIFNVSPLYRRRGGAARRRRRNCARHRRSYRQSA